MNNRLSPDQLPHGSGANFIAYDAPVRVANPEGGDPLTARSQVYVRYYPAIKVKELQVGGADGDKKDLVTVQFDPKSVSIGDDRTLTRKISAHCDADEKTLEMLREAQANDQFVAIGIETQRKAKNAATKASINPLIPIHALRGADGPDGSGVAANMQGPSGETTVNRLALVNGQSTKHTRSDPAEWLELMNNKAGDLPPEGWRHYAIGEEWTQIGAAVPSESPSRANAGSQGGVSDQTALLDAIRGIVSAALEDHHDTSTQPQSIGRSVQRNGKFREGLTYDARTSHGFVNLGGYVPSAWHWAVRFANTQLTALAADGGDDKDTIGFVEEWTLAEHVMNVADQVQVQAYLMISDERHHEAIEIALPDRTAASHRDAERWVEWSMERHHPLSAASDAADPDYQAMVVETAAGYLAEAGHRTDAGMQEVAKRTSPRNAPRQETASKDEGPSTKIVTAFVQTVQRAWDKKDALGKLGATSQEKGYDDIIISAERTDDGVILSLPPAEGAPQEKLVDVLRGRYRELPDTAVAPATSPTSAPVSPASPSPTSPVSAPATPVSPQSPPTQVGSDATRGARAAAAATDEDKLHKIFQHAQSENLLAQIVWVKPGQGTAVEVGESEEGGYMAKSLSAVIDLCLKHLTAGPSTGQHDNTQEPAQQEPAASDDAATAQDLAERGDAAGGDLAALTALLDEVRAKNLQDVAITIGGRTGALGAYLVSRTKRAGRTP